MYIHAAAFLLIFVLIRIFMFIVIRSIMLKLVYCSHMQHVQCYQFGCISRSISY